MGGDGGSIPKREELVKTKRRPEQVGRDNENAAKWRHCALSQAPLRQPIVVCELGRLYNKEAVLEYLLDPKKFPNSNTGHIKRLKDVHQLSLTVNPEMVVNEAVQGGNGMYIDMNKADFICPVGGQEMNGRHGFLAVWSCGCVFSEKAYKTVEGLNCLKCGKPCNKEDLIKINPSTEEEIASLRTAMETRRTKLSSKTKKRRAPAESGATGTSLNSAKDVSSTSQSAAGPSNIKRTKKTDKSSSSTNANGIQGDTNKSKVFKSLFTTSEEAKSQPKNHWVTFNPLYFR